MPTAVGVKDADVALGGVAPLRVTVSGPNTGFPVQVASFGPNRLKVTSPVGLKPPVTVAVSLTEPPRMTPGEGRVVITADVATPISTGSSRHMELTGALLVSPLYLA